MSRRRASGDGDPAPDDIDIRIGACIRESRTAIGMSQEKLGERLGLTFQQIQKYERGINRVSAARLRDLCLVFSKPARYFLPGIPSEYQGYELAEDAPDIHDRPPSLPSDHAELLAHFSRIADPEIRAGVLELVKKLAKIKTPTEK